MNGTTYKRCSCTNPATGRPYGRACPKLRRPGGSWHPTHGIWQYQCELPPTADGKRRPLRRGGFATKADADTELDRIRTLLALADEPSDATRVGDLIAGAISRREPLPDQATVRRLLHSDGEHDDVTVGEWLDAWLAGRRSLRETTRRNYADNIRKYLKPHLGHIKLVRLTGKHVAAMFDAINAHNEAFQAYLADPDLNLGQRFDGDRRTMKPAGPAAQRRIQAALRAALNAAMRRQMITYNAATHVELPPVRSVKPLIWTDQRVAEWRRTGHIPSPVMVWTAEQTGAFLDHIIDDPLYAMYHLIALRGLRRGEACGLHRADLDLDALTLTVRHQVVVEAWKLNLTAPKTDGSEATIALDTTTARLLREHLEHQHDLRERAGVAWVETGLVFTREDGSMIHPDYVTRHFKEAIAETGLPPIRLHDLRHGAATLALAGGADIKTVQAMLRHSTIVLTANTYTSVLPQVAREAAEAAAALVPRAR
ncbi:site-specific integrase [Dactylosporangium roseum]|uniref:Site-specific integrase n=1 Tax=Dactylosporangium roseum TaxID=47989 RepID=A0ABY5Z4S1_9ACTN|nr:site-specific integrase [Dactylosporangium roseum]UWZ37045.1 site-specific integrase [Dactylosporangium roseum]